MPALNKISFQDSNSPAMEQLDFFHSHTMLTLVLIMSVAGHSLAMTMMNKNTNLKMYESQTMELFWTVSPAAILLMIGLPSIRILYLTDEIYEPLITLKTLGHQWYWSYEYSDFPEKEFDSYLAPSVENKTTRLLETDNFVPLPFGAQIRNLVSSSDVLHSWTVPSLGVKVDAVPGRLNQLNMWLSRPGVFFGQCSEICGANHSFMPISVEGVKMKDFIKWISY